MFHYDNQLEFFLTCSETIERSINKNFEPQGAEELNEVAWLFYESVEDKKQLKLKKQKRAYNSHRKGQF